jgi:hypothetical protein
MKKTNKLIKNIKAGVKKQIEADIKDSVVKQFQSSSKKELKKLKKQILREVQEDMFSSLVTKKTKKPKKKKTNVAPEEKVESNKGTFEYKGFKFEREKMCSLVTGKKKPTDEKYPSPKPSDKLPGVLKEALNKDKKNNNIKIKTQDDIMMEMRPTQAGNYTTNGTTQFPLGMPFGRPAASPSAEDFIGKFLKSQKEKTALTKKPAPELTPEKKEELTFFIGKLKEGVSKLKNNEKNIDYRKKGENNYNFSFERKADFDLKFDLNLDMKTYCTSVDLFEFRVDGFRFDKKFIELFDIVEVLDLVGFNMNNHINGINGINEADTIKGIDMKRAKTPTAIKKKTIRSNTKIENIIDDSKLVGVLAKNDISNYGQLKKVDDLTSLKGVGAKTADRINEYLKSK